MMKNSCNLTFKLEVKSVTCPGVWLCLNGYVSLIVSTLGIEYETKHISPVFPLIFHDVFYFNATIDEVNNLTTLKNVLKNKAIIFLLVQWPLNCSCDQGKVLSKFYGFLDQLLYPTNDLSNGIHLLMKPSNIFPGILAPKIEIITVIKIAETFGGIINVPSNIQKHVRNINLNFTKKDSKRQHAVCHSQNYHRKYEKYQYDSENQIDIDKKKMLCGPSSNTMFPKSSFKYLTENKVLKVNHLSSCGICSEYNRIFKNKSAPLFECGNKIEEGLTYTICNKSPMKDFDEEIPKSLQNKLENIFLDHMPESQLFGNDVNSWTSSYCSQSSDNVNFRNQLVPECLVKKFEKIKLHCLCNK